MHKMVSLVVRTSSNIYLLIKWSEICVWFTKKRKCLVVSEGYKEEQLPVIKCIRYETSKINLKNGLEERFFPNFGFYSTGTGSE
jgi:hypothetical protein